MTLFRKHIFVEGSKEKLHRFIQRSNGKMLESQRFRVDLKDNKLKRQRAFPFRFHCSYQKADCGYDIRYCVTPTPVGFVRVGIWLGLLSLLICQNRVNAILVGGTLMILYLMNLSSQRSHCISQFVTELDK